MDAIGAHSVIATLCVLTITAIGLVIAALAGVAPRGRLDDDAHKGGDVSNEGR